MSKSTFSAIALALAFAGSAALLAQGRGGRAGAVTIKEGEECPSGMTEFRHLQCAPPASPAPTILDYRPRSTVVAEPHLVPKAKFPVVDVHSHTTATADNMPQLIKEMDALNLRVLVNLSGGDAAAVKQKMDAINASPYKDRFRVFANVNWEGAGGPGWQEKALADLRQAAKNGAIGLKVFKELGLRNKKFDGTLLKVDDPVLDPIWALAGELNIPVIIHTAEPEEFFAPLDNHNERWLELNIFQDRYRPSSNYPSFEDLMQQRDHMFAKHPKTRFIAAHFAWYGNDLKRAAHLLDTLPNVVLEVAAVLYEFGRQPLRVGAVLHEVSGPDHVRQGHVRAERVSVLLARLRNARRVLRLLPQLPRVLEAVWNGAAGRRAEEALLQERAARRARSAADRMAAMKS